MCVHCVCVGSLAFHHLQRHLMLWTIQRKGKLKYSSTTKILSININRSVFITTIINLRLNTISLEQ